MRLLAIALLSVLLGAGCASTPPPVADLRYFDDARFGPPSVRISAADIFALSPEMKAYAATEIATRARTRGRQHGLLDALYTKGDLRLEYDTDFTRNAAQAFAARSGNCLSLVIMTAAFARELGLHVDFQKVYVDDAWARDGGIYLAIGHVNLVLGARKVDGGGFGYRVGKRPPESVGMMVDFLPPIALRNVRTYSIGEDVIVGMYMNNRAVEALARGRFDDAYGWVREAIVQSPDFLPAYNTLGALYHRHGDLRQAEMVLSHLLGREPNNIQALSNLAGVLAALGRKDEADRLLARLDALDPDPPFAHFNRGLAAMEEGNAQGAREAFAREVARAPDYHEFHFWLAIALANLGETEDAAKHLALAKENSTTRREHDLYAAKLDRIEAARTR